MQLVVEISEDTFFDLKKKQNRTEVDNAVLQGTPLPKGHGRLIDADKVITLALKQKTLVLKDTDLIDISSREFVIDYLFKDIKDYINNMPTIIEADKRSIRNEKNELWYIDRI